MRRLMTLLRIGALGTGLMLAALPMQEQPIGAFAARGQLELDAALVKEGSA